MLKDKEKIHLGNRGKWYSAKLGRTALKPCSQMDQSGGEISLLSPPMTVGLNKSTAWTQTHTVCLINVRSTHVGYLEVVLIHFCLLLRVKWTEAIHSNVIRIMQGCASMVNSTSPGRGLTPWIGLYVNPLSLRWIGMRALRGTLCSIHFDVKMMRFRWSERIQERDRRDGLTVHQDPGENSGMLLC